MEKIDKLIETIVSNISKEIEKGSKATDEINALANLMVARANYEIAVYYHKSGSSHLLQED